ncbi:hypothetical protein QBC43DRAFT_334971 [Cladorrhinum sp. PSN259]|nr:hypothetical protein QBC43DRAFT_334971 [Cladorrhinum sp. PSN259]
MPMPTPTSTILMPPRFRAFARQFNNTTTATAETENPDKTETSLTTLSLVNPDKCTKFDATQTCSAKGEYGSCLAKSGEPYCRCNNGPQYLSCVSSAIATSSCTGVVNDWDGFERSWLLGSCSAPPSSVMAVLPQPTSVSLSVEPVTLTTPPVPVTDLPPAVPTTVFYQPSSGGKLLEGDCSSTSFSVINAGDVMFYVPLVGCNANRPECCPWIVSGRAAGQVATDQQTTAGPNTRNFVAAVAGQFPMPQDGQLIALPKCPNDYYSVSGMCCPNGYLKFTRLMASQTPCFSSLAAKATPPMITVGAPGVPPQNSSIPTSALVNIALAMSYQVEHELPPSSSSSSGLSQGAVIGIGIGAGIGAILLIALIACLVVRARSKKKTHQPVPQMVNTENPFADAPGLGGGVVDPVSPGYGQGQQQGMTYKAGYHAPSSPPPPSSPTPLGGSYAPTVGSSHRYTPTVVSIPASELPDPQQAVVGQHGYGQGHARQFSNGSWAEREHGQGTYGHVRGYSDGSQGGQQSQGWQQGGQARGGVYNGGY